jgi:CheY-like chemotaxis protein
MNTRTVLSVGQCRPDGAALAHYLTKHFHVNLLTADLPADAIQLLRDNPVDLVLINRQLDADGSDGMKILAQIRSGPSKQDVPIMLVSNYPEWQQKAVEAGAVYGFGRAELNSPETRTKLAAILAQGAASEKADTTTAI